MQDHRTCQISWTSRAGTAIIAGIILILTLLLLTCPVSGTVFLKNGSEVTGDDPFSTIISDPDFTEETYPAEFFYDTNCGACHVAMAYLTEYKAAHPDARINFTDIANSPENRALFEEYKTAYQRSYISVPVVFIGNAGLEGESAIRENLVPLISRYERNRNDSTMGNDTPAPVSDPEIRPHKTVISIPFVLIAGIVDGINPCACAVLVFLLVCLMTIREHKRVLPVGVAFSCSVFLFYFLSGTGLFTVSRDSELVTVYSLVCGIIAVIAGVVLIIRAILTGSGENTGGSGRDGAISGYLWRFPLLLPFLLGLLAGILELPCIGGIYITILDMISFRVNMEQGFVYLFIYNLAFIIPLLILTGLVYWAMPDRQGNGIRPGQHRAVTLFTGLLLFVFAFFILSGVI